jgi:transposase
MLSTQAETDLQEEVRQLRNENVYQKTEIDNLKLKVQALLNKLFGTGKSERIDPAQLLLLLEGLNEEIKQEADKEKEVVPGYDRTKKGDGPVARHPIPENLEVVTQEIIPAEVKLKPEAYVQIGVVETQELDLIPAKFIKRIYRRLKFKLKDELDATPIIAPLPGRLIEGGLPGVGLIVQIILSKYVDHLPLYRQEQIYKRRFGVNLSRQTMADWIRVVAENWLILIYHSIKKGLLSGDYLQVDETPIEYLDENHKGKTRKGWLWVYSHPGGDVLYDWKLSRGADSLRSFLTGFSGIVQSDGYAVYDKIAQEQRLTQIGCWAHARRKFFEAYKLGQEGAIWYLHQIGQLYKNEKYIQGEALDAATYRKEKSLPILREIRKRLEVENTTASGLKTELAKAISYTLSQWRKLIGYIDYSEVKIDNNYAEQSIRPTKLGAKNWLFIGHPEAGQRSAIIYTVVESCKRHGVEVQEYLTDVLKKLPNMTNHQARDANLTPKLWKRP